MSFDRSVDSRVIVGSRTRIGEGVSIHRSIEKTGETTVGDDCFLMGYAHIAHDCILAHRVTLANGVLLGGHVSVGKDVFLGGGAAVHQFVRIGQGAMVGGLAEVSMDIPSQALASGRNQVSGLNLIGLKRRNVSRENITELKHVFSQVMTLGNKREKAIEILQGEDCPTSDIAKEFLKFFGDGQRGFARLVNKHT